jgi:hypothetical protein
MKSKREKKKGRGGADKTSIQVFDRIEYQKDKNDKKTLDSTST